MSSASDAGLSKARRFWSARCAEVVVGAILVGLLNCGDSRVAPATAVASGALVALALGVVALRIRAPIGRRTSGPALATGIYLTFRAAFEEVVWRLTVTGRLAAAAGWPLGLAVGSVGFAVAHARRGRAAVLIHVLTGFAFGGLYLATGRLVAPVVAHGLYNLVLLRASLRASG